MSDTWDPDRYGQFRAARRQPFDDLLALVEPAPGGRAVDLGCGSGELTVDLHHHVGAASTVGIDTSTNMLERAGAHAGSGVRFERADIATWLPPSPVDVVVANASLQWVPSHDELLRRLHDRLTAGGQLAVQVPANFDHPTHTVADRIGQQHGVDAIDRFEAVLAPEAYAALLDRIGFVEIHVRLQVYVHHLASTASVIEWVQGTLLTEYRRALSVERYERFVDEYRTALLVELGDPEGDAPYTHLFKRILFRARRPSSGR